jgi:2-(1,2-epoxy-1,2-dihydrophenyl)acetyl-CoA isomerase
VDDWEYLEVAGSGPVLTITLNEPRRRNPLSLPMREELLSLLERVTADDGVRVVVLTGAGTIFCAGGDIASMSDDRAAGIHRLRVFNQVMEALVALPKPVVAAVEGGAFGAGLSLMAACDHVVAAEDATLRSSFGGIGLGTDGGLSWTLPRRVGYGRAAEIVMFGDPMDAYEAQRIGLVERVVPAGTALAEAQARAELLAARSRPALAANKATLNTGRSLHDVLDAEMHHQLDLMAGADFAEGRAAFGDRRPPEFRA